jgi:hypothetical protein
MEPKIQQELQQLVQSTQNNFQKGIDAIQRGSFRKGSLFFGLAARDNDSIADLLNSIEVK